MADQFLSEADRVLLEAQADAVALLAQRTFEPDTLPPLDMLCDAVAPAMIQALEQICTSYRQQYRELVINVCYCSPLAVA